MKTIDQHIKAQQFQNAYLLYGDEDYLKKQYRDKLVHALVPEDDSMNFAKFEGKDINLGEVIDLAETLPFFANRRVILIADSGFFKSSQEQLADYLGQIQETTYFVFVESEVDKRSKTYKALSKSGCAVDFSMPDEKLLTTWMGSRLKAAGKSISREAWQEFFERTNDSMDHMDKEMEKLLSYTYDKDSITLEDVEAICTKQVQTKIFDMISFIASKNLPKVMELYHDMLAAKEPPIRILALIIRQFDQMYLLKDMASTGMNASTIASKLGIRDFIVKKNLGLARNFTMEQIRQLLEDAADLDERAKTGLINDRMAVELLMIKYSK
ncbi:MAG: DNA polymerase III subunit delta [Lachnospiraceae bacterium]|nr:DNA polymerase III subunit delta [Lachnospiraceae bacterium]